MKGRIRFVPAAALATALATALCWGMFLFYQREAQARTLTPVEGAVFDTAGSLADNLKAYAGKDIIVHLRSGKTIQGYVKSIGNGLLHVEKLSGRDFYDALIRIEDISAIEAKFRDMK